LPAAKEKYLLVKIIGGLGNLTHSLLTAILMARITGRRLIVDWTDANYSDRGENVIHSYFQSPYFSPEDKIPDTNSVTPAVWRGRLRRTTGEVARLCAPKLRYYPHSWRLASVDPRRLDREEEVMVFWSFYPLLYRLRPNLKGEFEHLRHAEETAVYREVLRESLTLHPSIMSRVEKFRSAQFRTPMIGVHARYTDRKVKLAAVHRRVRKLLEFSPDAGIFLATDSKVVQNQFEKSYRMVVSTPREYAADGGPIHKIRDDSGAKERGAQALVDLYLLGSCEYLVIDEGSTFSYLAALLFQNDPSRIYNVQRGAWIPRRLRNTIWSLAMDAWYAPRLVKHLWWKLTHPQPALRPK